MTVSVTVLSVRGGKYMDTTQNPRMTVSARRLNGIYHWYCCQGLLSVGRIWATDIANMQYLNIWLINITKWVKPIHLKGYVFMEQIADCVTKNDGIIPVWHVVKKEKKSNETKTNNTKSV